ncbi:MAG: response regulator [Ruegeria sp.]|nr:response regulator [Ruegeria sp.]
MRILAVDDDPVVLSLLMGILGRAGYVDIACCSSAAEARWHLDDGHEVDCFLLDIRMPDEDGISLCKSIRARAGHVNTPIIMLTALTDVESVNDAFEAGATEYVTKPFDGLELGARIRTAVALNRMRQQVAETIEAANQVAKFPGETSGGTPHEMRPYLGVPGAIEFVTLENYLLRLETRVCTTHIFAFQVEGLQAYLSGINNLPARHALIAGLLQCLVSGAAAKGLVSYAGNGVFVYVKFNGKPLKAEELADRLKNEISDLMASDKKASRASCNVKILRYHERELLTGRQAADFLRASIDMSGQRAGMKTIEEELRDILYADLGYPPILGHLRALSKLLSAPADRVRKTVAPRSTTPSSKSHSTNA